MFGATFGLLITWLSLVSALEHRCNASICTLIDVQLSDEFDVGRASFPKLAPKLVFESGRIPMFGRSLASKLNGVTHLTVDNLQIESLFVSTGWEQLSAVGNSIRTLNLDTTSVTYSMLALQLADNQLSEVPSMGKFSRLRILNLDGNNIEKLSMEAFMELNELRELSLARNGLRNLSSPSMGFTLPMLRSLSLAHNELRTLEISNWELDSLETFIVRGNQLQELDGDLSNFERLNVLHLGNNRWSCEWLHAKLQRFIRDRKSIKVDADTAEDCGANGAHMLLVGRICCEGRQEHPVVSAGKFADRWTALKTVTQRYQLFRNEANFAIEPVKVGITGTRLALQELLQNSTDKLNEVTVQAKNAQFVMDEQLEILRSKRQALGQAIDGIRSTMLTYFHGQSDRLDAFANDVSNNVTQDHLQLTAIIQRRTVKLNQLFNMFRVQAERTVRQNKQLKTATELLDNLQRSSERLNNQNQKLEELFNDMIEEFLQITSRISSVAEVEHSRTHNSIPRYERLRWPSSRVTMSNTY